MIPTSFTVCADPALVTYFITVHITVVVAELVVARPTELCAGCVEVVYITEDSEFVLDEHRAARVDDCLPVKPR